MSDILDRFGCAGFQWDEHNAVKIRTKHRVSPDECEQVFFRHPVLVVDAKRSEAEQRLAALGQTAAGRLLFVVFTLRADRIRVISARDMHRTERKVYFSS